MKKIILFASDISSIPGLTGAVEVFNIANILWNLQHPGSEPIFQCSAVSLERIFQSFCDGVTIEFNKALYPYEQADAVLTTGFVYQDLLYLIEKIQSLKKTKDWFQRQYDQGAAICATCSGTALLAETKLLDGKTATTSWWLEGLFRTRYPKVNVQIERLIIEDGRFITAGAVTSYLNLALYLIEKFADKSLALSCSKIILTDINKFYQAPYITLQTSMNHPDKMVEKGQYWIHGNFHKKIDIHILADNLAVSYRTLMRRFKEATGDSPVKYLQKVRIEAAKRLLETTDLNLESIIERVGYVDPSTFSVLFKKLTRLTPKEYRLRFSLRHKAIAYH